MITNAVTAVVLVALGVAALVGGPGMWPKVVGGVLTVLGLVLLALVRRTDDTEPFGRTGLLVLAAVGSMVAFVALLPVIGFEIPSVVLAFVWMRFLGKEGWRTSAITSTATVVVLYALFVGLLSVPIPHLF